MTNSTDPEQFVLKKPTDLDLYCLQNQDISRFSRARVNTLCRFSAVLVREQTSDFLFALIAYQSVSEKESTLKRKNLLPGRSRLLISRGSKFFPFTELFSEGDAKLNILQSCLP